MRASIGSMRKLIYYVSITADGFIATQAGGFEVFLQEGPHLPDMLRQYPETLPGAARAPLGLVDTPNRVFDTVLMGRATYEVGAKQGVGNPYPHLQQFVFSRTLERTGDGSVQLVASDALGCVRKLKQSAGMNIWLCGGGQLAAALYPEIDELVLKVHPVLIGAGIPLFGQEVTPARMTLREHQVYDNGYARMHYALR